MGTSYTIKRGYGYTFDEELLYSAIPDAEDYDEWFQENYPLLEPVWAGLYDYAEIRAVSVLRWSSHNWDFTWTIKELPESPASSEEFEQLVRFSSFIGLTDAPHWFGALSVG